MPPIAALSFDCAETLIRVRWSPGSFALDCARAVGLQLDEQVAAETYTRLLGSRWTQYTELNTTRDHSKCMGWWRELTVDWLDHLGHSDDMVDRIMEASNVLLYGPDSPYFETFADVEATLAEASAAGIRRMVISNWDYSLHRVLQSKNLHGNFEAVLASLEEGVEKPDRRLFAIGAERLGLEPNQILHVGDNPLDDYRGALEAGFRAVLLARDSQAAPGIRSIRTLTELLPLVSDWQD